MDLNSLIQFKRERFDQLERDITDPALFSNRQRAKEIMREHASIKQLLAKWNELEAARKQLDDNRELAMSAMLRSRRWPTTKFRSWKNKRLISNAIFRSPYCQRMKMKSATPSWKFVPERAEMKQPFLLPICTVCTIDTQNPPG